MKVPNVITVVATLLLPAACFAQYYQTSGPAYRPAFQQAVPTAAPMATPTMPGSPMAAMPTAPSPRMPVPAAPAPANYGGVGSNFCDASGCDSGYGGGAGFVTAGCGADAGCGIDGGAYSCGMDGTMGCASDGFGGGMSCCGVGGGCNTYFSIFGGATEMDDQNSVGLGRNLNITYDQGYMLGGAIGRRLFRNLRSELEYTFRSQDAEIVQFNGGTPGNVGGFQNSHSGMFNLVYDLVMGSGNFVPYVGVGAGIAFVDSRVTYGSGVASLDGDDSAAAYQWMAGMAWRARPNMEAFLEYRFFEIMDPKINRFGGPAIGSATNPNVLLESEYLSNDIVAGFRFNF